MVIVPIPKKVIKNKNRFTFDGEISIKIEGFSPHLINVFKSDLNLKNEFIITSDNPIVEFKLDKIPKEGYKISVQPDKILIASSSDEGIYYAIKTLKQIKVNNSLECVEIEDYPDLEFMKTREQSV